MASINYIIQQKTLPDEPFLGSIQYTIGRPLDYYDGKHIQNHPPCDVMMWDSGSTSLAEDKHYESYFNWNPYLCFKFRIFALSNVAELAW